MRQRRACARHGRAAPRSRPATARTTRRRRSCATARERWRFSPWRDATARPASRSSGRSSAPGSGTRRASGSSPRRLFCAGCAGPERAGSGAQRWRAPADAASAHDGGGRVRRGGLNVPGPADVAAALPWIAFALVVPLLLRFRPRLDRHPPPPSDARPLVSIIVPARNEAENIGTCVATLVNTSYPQREIIVVDDGSTDGTTDIARLLAARSAGAIRLVEGEPLPDGWMGKCWACWQGYEVARGELLCFTDADTRHDDDLLGHAVGALTGTGADLVSVLPRQLMESFWERVVLPHIFTMISLRYRH